MVTTTVGQSTPLLTGETGRPSSRRTRRRSSRGRLVGGCVLATALALPGAGLATAGVLQSGEGGYFTTPSAAFSTPTSALVTDEILVEAGRPGDPSMDVGDLARVRVRAVPADPGRPVFVGIGPKAEVDAYLRSVSHDRMVSFELDPLAVQFARSTAPGSPPAPTASAPWAASVSGAGPQELQWDKSVGAWSAVVMNADGSAGVDVRLDVGLRFGFLLPLGAALLAAGLLALGLALRRR